jgi:deoxyribose-phosphate aldolase
LLRAGVDYVKTSTGTEGFPDIAQVNIMKSPPERRQNEAESFRIPRTFSLPATLAMLDMGVS